MNSRMCMNIYLRIQFFILFMSAGVLSLFSLLSAEPESAPACPAQGTFCSMLVPVYGQSDISLHWYFSSLWSTADCNL